MITSAILAGVETAINRLLPLDAEVAEELTTHKGKVVKLMISDLAVVVFVRMREQRLLLSENYDGDVDATISGSSVQLLKSYTHGFSVGSGIEVDGNVELVENLNKTMNKYHIDWEELWSHVVGDIAAHRIHGAVSDIRAWGKDAKDRLFMDVSEYIHEEAKLSPSKEELDDFFADIAKVRDGVERAQVRINRLNQES